MDYLGLRTNASQTFSTIPPGAPGRPNALAVSQRFAPFPDLHWWCFVELPGETNAHCTVLFGYAQIFYESECHFYTWTKTKFSVVFTKGV